MEGISRKNFRSETEYRAYIRMLYANGYSVKKICYIVDEPKRNIENYLGIKGQ